MSGRAGNVPLERVDRPGADRPGGDGETLSLRPGEPSPPGWLITRTPGGPVWEHGSADADVTATGPVQDLLPVSARRLAPDDAAEVKATGDASLLEHWLAHSAVWPDAVAVRCHREPHLV